MNLHEHWAEVERELERARGYLPSELMENTTTGTLAQYEEFLAANELQLALEELEGVAEQSTCPPTFWVALKDAAERMELREHVSRYAQRAEAGS